MLDDMESTASIRLAIMGLAAFAAMEEELLLEGARHSPSHGSPDNWAAVPIVVHNTEFKSQQVTRLRAVAAGETPPAFGEVDHRSTATYAGYSAVGLGEARRAARSTTSALFDALSAVGDEDLTDPSSHPWLAGRKLWLQVVVRSFWHPSGHIAEYYLSNGTPERAVAMQTQGLAVAEYLKAPKPARGMAAYNLACAEARSGLVPEARASLALAVELNSDLDAKAGGDPDLEPLRASDRLDESAASQGASVPGGSSA